ncbi:MAG: polysaccharide deacetylase family protein [Fimbriimonadaceae bacterium]|nr:polysaccharide deacetylase family protein [Chitinophagales bacterium]
MYFVKTPWYLKSVYPSLIWDIKKQTTLYLTFDDGPIPMVTEEILKILKDYNARATFFVIGDNVFKHKSIYEKILMNEHIIGNHTMHHTNGWKTENELYYRDVQLCEDIIQSKIFRPPYGRIGYNQIQHLKKDFSIYMWDVLSGDFDTNIDVEQCTKNVIEHATDGSIIVFHDSEKAKDRVLKSLPKVLEYFSRKGYSFESIN